MRRESNSERQAWTEFVDGKSEAAPVNKFGNKRTFFNGKWYPSQHEANWAAKLQPLAERGLITDYREQERIVLVPGDGKLRPIVYIADFTFVEDGRKRVLDAKSKGTKTAVYRLKKKLAAMLLRIHIEEV